ncbi:MAG: hypothetical protein ACK40G_13585 [Cytophagaceae bacterium]
MNKTILKILGPILIAAGAAGYIVPEDFVLLSRELASNMTYINAGFISLIIAFTNNNTLTRAFNYLQGFLMIFLIVATWVNIFPAPHLNYQFLNTMINLNVGLILMFIAIFWDDNKRVASE